MCSQKIHTHLEMPKIDSVISCLPLGIMIYLRVSQFWRAISTGFVRSSTGIVALDAYILCIQRIWNYFVAEMWIILGVGTWPNTQLCQNSKLHLGQLPISLFGIFRCLWIFWLCLMMFTAQNVSGLPPIPSLVWCVYCKAKQRTNLHDQPKRGTSRHCHSVQLLDPYTHRIPLQIQINGSHEFHQFSDTGPTHKHERGCKGVSNNVLFFGISWYTQSLLAYRILSMYTNAL